MNLGIVLAILGTCLFVALFLSGYALLMTRPNISRRITPTEKKRSFDFISYLKRSEKVLKPLGEMLPRSPEEMSRQERRLVQAGIRRRDAPALFYGFKLALAVLLFLTFLFTGLLKSNVILYSVLPILLGGMLPDIWLSRRISARKDQIQVGLPDALDLSVVCVEAGLGLDQSLTRIGKELGAIYPHLSEEFNLYNLEVNAGRKRADALRNMGDRTQVDDLKAFVAVLIQTDRFGTGIAQSLRVFADTMRVKRRQRAEERAAKMNIKMIPPLVFFIFPAIFVVVLGPAIIAIIRYLVPCLGGGQP